MQSLDNPLGDFSASQFDNAPTPSNIVHVKDDGAFRRLSRRLYSMHHSNVGRALTEPEETEFLKSTYLDIVIPDEEEQSVHGKYVSNALINSDIPERQAESRMDILNSIDIPEEEIDQLKELISEYSMDLKTVIMDAVVPYIAFDNASAMVEAIMRDGLGISMQVDTSVISPLQDVTKLAVISRIVERSSLSKRTKREFLSTLTTALTSDITAIRKTENSQRYSQVLHNLVTSRRSVPESAALETNPMGILKKFHK